MNTNVGTVYVCIAPLFGAAGSVGSFGFTTAASTAAATSAPAPQSAGFVLGGGQTATAGLTFGSAALGAQPTSTQTTAALPVFSLPTTATGQAGGFQFGGVQPSSAAAPGFGLGAGVLTTSTAGTTLTTGFTFGAIPGSSTSTGPTGLLGTGTAGQTGATSLFGGVRPGLSCDCLATSSNLCVI